MWFPSAGLLLTLHDRLIERTGGEGGVLHRPALQGIIARIRDGPFEAEADILHRAALLLRGIAAEHPFVDGNKRTAFAATDLFLALNGQIVVASEDEVVDFMLRVARGEEDLGGIESWLRANARNL